MRRAILAMAFVLAPLGCSVGVEPARDQWRVIIATDAPVPEFGDRVLIEIIGANEANACNGCRREISVLDPSVLPLSFGIEPDGGDPPRVRARLYRTSDTGPDGPGSDRIVDALVHLPSPSGVTDVGIVLSMTCFGQLADVDKDTSCDPKTGGPAASPTLPRLAEPSSLPKPSTWPNAARVDCQSPAPAGMACIPGGAFLLGNPTYVPLDGDTMVLGSDPVPEQLVQVAPFFLDKEEFTVGQVHAAVAELGEPATDQPMCEYRADSSRDGMPLNCITRDYARRLCARLGKRLPLEAEWEWAAGNLTAETPYPWPDGSDDVCAHAVVARGDGNDSVHPTACRTSMSDPSGPAVGGNSADMTAQKVMNLGGNVSEWTDDDFTGYGDSTCWGQSVSLHMITPSKPCRTSANLGAVRGGSWGSFEFAAHSYERDAAPVSGYFDDIGFRCAMDAK